MKKVSRPANRSSAYGAKKPGATGVRTTTTAPEPRKKISAPASVSVSGEVAASRSGKAAGSPNPRRAFSKGPTAEQWTAMSGAMYNALERLREFSARTRRRADANDGWIQPGHVPELLEQVDAAANILRVGLKARFRK